MIIVHLIYDDLKNPWLGGGGSVRTHEIYRRLAASHKITVITAGYPGALPEEIREGVRYRRVGWGQGYVRSRFSFVIAACQAANREACDLVVDDFSPYSPSFAPLRTKGPILASVQTLFGGKYLVRKDGLRAVVPYCAQRWCLPLYRHFIATSPAIYTLLRERVKDGSMIRMIPYGVEERLFQTPLREERYLLYLGRLEIYQKGLDILIQAFADVIRKVPDIQLKIAGSGRDENRLRLMVAEHRLDKHVEFIGRVEGDEKAQLLANSLFVCMPSRYESWGIVAVEAAACGKAVIGSDIAALADLLRDGQCGVLVPPEDPGRLAEAMKDLIQDGAARQRLGASGRVWARDYSWDRVAVEQERFYFDVAGSVR